MRTLRRGESRGEYGNTPFWYLFFRGSRAAKKDFLCVAPIVNFASSSETGISHSPLKMRTLRRGESRGEYGNTPFWYLFFRGSRAAKKDFLCVAPIVNFASSSETGIYHGYWLFCTNNADPAAFRYSARSIH